MHTQTLLCQMNSLWVGSCKSSPSLRLFPSFYLKWNLICSERWWRHFEAFVYIFFSHISTKYLQVSAGLTLHSSSYRRTGFLQSELFTLPDLTNPRAMNIAIPSCCVMSLWAYGLFKFNEKLIQSPICCCWVVHLVLRSFRNTDICREEFFKKVWNAIKTIRRQKY